MIGIYDPDLTHAGHDVFMSFSHILEDLANYTACLDLDYNGSDEEVDPYKGRNVYMATRDNTQAVTEARSSTSRPPTRFSNAPMINIILPWAMTESTLRPRNLNSNFRVA